MRSLLRNKHLLRVRGQAKGRVEWRSSDQAAPPCARPIANRAYESERHRVKDEDRV